MQRLGLGLGLGLEPSGLRLRLGALYTWCHILLLALRQHVEENSVDV